MGPSATYPRVTEKFGRNRGIVTASVPEASNQKIGQKKGKARFPRTARLLRHADFERVYTSGRRHFSPSMTVFYWQRQEDANVVAKPAAKGLRIGFTVSRAHGGAVTRNRMKRRLREAVRLSRPPVGPNADVVINPKKAVLTIEFEAVLNEVRRAFAVIEQKLSGHSARAQ
jgi:ribonuclease P protein component